MREQHCDVDEAFEQLKRESHSTNLKLREVAQALVGETTNGQREHC